MKKIGIIALVLVMMLGVAAIDTYDVFAQKASAEVTTTSVEESTVTVNGEGKVVLNPDIAYITIGVETKDKDASVAQASNKKIMNEVLDAVKAEKVAEDDMQTQNYSIYKTYDYTKPSTEEREEIFQVTNQLKITVRDIENVGNLIDVVTTAGANNINSIQFDSTKKAEAYQEALKASMTNAKEKATSIMSTFGEVPNKPSKVTESTSSGGAVVYAESFAMKADSSTAIESGTLEVTAKVMVEYKY